MKLARLVIAGGVAFLCLAASAHAQDAVVEGPGVKLTEGTVLHPAVGAETGYISNVFYEDDDAVGSGVLRLSTNLDFAARPAERRQGGKSAPPKIDFRAGLFLGYYEYLSTNDNVRNQRDLEVGADAKFTAFPEGTVRFDIEDKFARVIRPTNFETDQSLDRDINELKLGLAFQPGGRAISAGARYQNRIEIFESDQSDFANRIQHTVGARTTWQFLPVTKFYLDGSYGFFGGLGEDAEMVKNRSNPLRVQLGAASVLTPKTTVRATAGWAKGFYDDGPDFSGFIARLEVGYRYSPLGRVVARYQRDFKDSINANFYTEHAGKVAASHQIDRVLLRGNAGLRFRTYEGVPMLVNPSSTTRDDVIVTAGLQARYIIQDRYAITGDYDLAIDETDFTSNVDTVDDPSYVRHAVFVGATAAF